jgi:hypothetical protein
MSITEFDPVWPSGNLGRICKTNIVAGARKVHTKPLEIIKK